MARAAHTKRGRLSAIDMLPDWAEEAKLWAFEQLNKNKKSQLDILDGFNARLKAAAFGQGITDPPVISKSAFNRTALRISLLGRRLQETREIAEVIAPKLDQSADNTVTLMVAESIKMLISEMLSNAGAMKADGPTAEMLMMTARALTAAEQAKKISGETKKKIETDLAERAAKAVDQVARQKGLTADTVRAIKSQILGVELKT